MDKQTFRLVTRQSRQNAVAAVASAPDGYHVTIAPPISRYTAEEISARSRAKHKAFKLSVFYAWGGKVKPEHGDDLS
jgi:hypothetical protein